MTDEPIPASRIAGCLLAGLALVVGVWYAAFGISLLINLPQATHRWIVASRDPDFWLDVAYFRGIGAATALLAIGLGIFSIRAAGRTFASRYEPRRHWLVLMARDPPQRRARLAEVVRRILTHGGSARSRRLRL